MGSKYPDASSIANSNRFHMKMIIMQIYISINYTQTKAIKPLNRTRRPTHTPSSLSFLPKHSYIRKVREKISYKKSSPSNSKIRNSMRNHLLYIWDHFYLRIRWAVLRLCLSTRTRWTHYMSIYKERFFFSSIIIFVMPMPISLLNYSIENQILTFQHPEIGAIQMYLCTHTHSDMAKGRFPTPDSTYICIRICVDNMFYIDMVGTPSPRYRNKIYLYIFLLFGWPMASI